MHQSLEQLPQKNDRVLNFFFKMMFFLRELKRRCSLVGMHVLVLG